MTMITPSYLGETIEYSSLHACRSTLEDPTTDPQWLRIVLRSAAAPVRYDPATLAAVVVIRSSCR